MLGNTPFLDSTHLFRVLEMLFYPISYCLIEGPVIMNDQNNIYEYITFPVNILLLLLCNVSLDPDVKPLANVFYTSSQQLIKRGR